MPVLMTSAGGLLSFGGVMGVRRESGLGDWAVLAFALLLALFALSMYRLIVARQDALVIRSFFDRTTLLRAEVALGVAVRHGTRSRSYSV